MKRLVALTFILVALAATLGPGPARARTGARDVETHHFTDPTPAALDGALTSRHDRYLEIDFTGAVAPEVARWFADRLSIRLGNQTLHGRSLSLFVSGDRSRTVFAEGEDARARIERYLSQVAQAPASPKASASSGSGNLSYTGYETTFLKNCKNSSGELNPGVEFIRMDNLPYQGDANPTCDDLAVTYQAYVSTTGDGRYFKNLSMSFNAGSQQALNTVSQYGARVQVDTSGANWGFIWEFAKAFYVTTSISRDDGYEDPTDRYGWVVTTSYPQNSSEGCSVSNTQSVTDEKGWNIGGSLTGEVGGSAEGPEGSVGIGVSAGVSRTTRQTRQQSVSCAYEEFKVITGDLGASSVKKVLKQELKTVGDPYNSSSTIGNMDSLSGIVDVNVADGRGEQKGDCSDTKYCTFKMDSTNPFPAPQALLPPSVQDGYAPGFLLQMQSPLDADAPRVETFNLLYAIDSYCGDSSSSSQKYRCGIYANHNTGGQVKRYDLLWTNGKGQNGIDYSQDGGNKPWDLAQIYVDPDESGFVVDWRDHVFYPIKSLYVQDQTTFGCWIARDGAIDLGAEGCPPSDAFEPVPTIQPSVFYLLVSDNDDPLGAFKISRWNEVSGSEDYQQSCLGVDKASSSLVLGADVCSDTSTYYTVWTYDESASTICSLNDDGATICLRTGPESQLVADTTGSGTPYKLFDPASGENYTVLSDPPASE